MSIIQRGFKFLGNCCCKTDCPPCPNKSRRGWVRTPIPGCQPCYDCPPCPYSLKVGWSVELGGDREHCPPCVVCPPCPDDPTKRGYPFGGGIINGCPQCPPSGNNCRCTTKSPENCCPACGNPYDSIHGKAPLFYIATVAGVQLPAPCPAASPCVATNGYIFAGDPNGSFLLSPVGSCTWATGTIDGMGYTIMAEDPVGDPGNPCGQFAAENHQIAMQLNIIHAVDGSTRAEFGYTHNIGVLMFQSPTAGADPPAGGIVENCCSNFTLPNINVQCPPGSHANGIGGLVTLRPVLL